MVGFALQKDNLAVMMQRKKVFRLQYTKKSIRPEKENTVLSKKDTFGEEKANKTNSFRVQPSGNAL